MVPLFWPRPIVAQRHGEHKVPKSRNEISLRDMGSFVCPFLCPSRGTSNGDSLSSLDSLPRGTLPLFWTPSPGTPSLGLSLIHISEPTRLGMISYAVFCLKKKKTKRN